MKLLLTLFIVVVGCSISTEGALNAESLLNKLKEKVDSVSDNLENYNIEASIEIYKKLDQMYEDQMTQLKASVNATVEEVNKKVESAESAGQEVRGCHQAFKARIEESQRSAETSYKKCVESGLEDLSSTQESVKIHLETKASISEELDQILWNCKSTENYQLCIAKDLPSATVLAGGYYTSTLALKESLKLFKLSVSLKTSVCFLKPQSTLALALLSASLSADECIANA